VEVKNADAVLFANVYFNGSVLGHCYVRVCKGSAARRHYTMSWQGL
jgi:hypothetical protein